MRRITSWLAVSALTVGGLAFVASTHAADPAAPNETGRVGTPTDTTGTVRTDTNTNTGTVRTDTQTTEVRRNDNGNNPSAAAPDADDIRKTVAKVTEDAVTKGDFHKLTKNFVDADYDRIKNFKASDNFAQLDGRIDQFRKDWRVKYGQDFKVDENKAFSDQFVSILQGEVTDPKALVGNWPVPATDRMADRAVTAAGKVDTAKQAKDADKPFGGDTNLEKGRNVALLYLPASHGAPALKLSLIHELPDIWRFDIPDNIDGQKLHDNLLHHLTWVDEHREQWPGDVNEAYRMVGHHLAMALYDVPMSEHGGSDLRR